MTDVRTAMVMAAGLGKRMRPLTDTRPKPLVEVGGRPMIDHCLAKLEKAGVTDVVVNVHYLADAMEAHLDASGFPFDFRISDERELLMETGGGLVQAISLIGADPFFCINSDNLWTEGKRGCLERMAEYWNADAMDALLLVVPHILAQNYKGAGDFHVDEEGRLSRRQADRRAPYIYTGIQLLSKRLLRDPPTGPFSTNILWDRAIEEGRLFGLVHEGQWFEVGSPDAIEPTELALASV